MSALNLNFFAFLGLRLFLILKRIFSVWSKLVRETEHLYRKRCSWQAVLYFLRIFEECFNTAFLFACLPYGSVSLPVCFYNEVQS